MRSNDKKDFKLYSKLDTFYPKMKLKAINKLPKV